MSMEKTTTPTTTAEQETIAINAGLQALAIRALVNDLAAARVQIAELKAQIGQTPIGGDK